MRESYDIWTFGNDEEIMKIIQLANIACGFHASDFNHMRQTVNLAKKYKVSIGAHPSLPDLQGFCRREMSISRSELANCLIYQIGALNGFLQAEGVQLNHIKPHGALYTMAARNANIAHAICDTADVFQVPIIGMENTQHAIVYKERNHGLISEFYADLEYSDDGNIIITRSSGPVDIEAKVQRCVDAIANKFVESENHQAIAVNAKTICIHSDTPNAPELAFKLRAALDLQYTPTN
jgi:UPF0271 protein